MAVELLAIIPEAEKVIEKAGRRWHVPEAPIDAQDWPGKGPN